MRALRLKSPASRLFAQQFAHGQIKENIKAPRHWPLGVESIGGFPSQRASNAENISIWWRHHGSWLNAWTSTNSTPFYHRLLEVFTFSHPSRKTGIFIHICCLILIVCWHRILKRKETSRLPWWTGFEPRRPRHPLANGLNAPSQTFYKRFTTGFII